MGALGNAGRGHARERRTSLGVCGVCPGSKVFEGVGRLQVTFLWPLRASDSTDLLGIQDQISKSANGRNSAREADPIYGQGTRAGLLAHRSECLLVAPRKRSGNLLTALSCARDSCPCQLDDINSPRLAHLHAPMLRLQSEYQSYRDFPLTSPI